MATFNPSNGCILASSQGTVCPLDPNYSNALGETEQSGNIKTVGHIKINSIIRSPITAVSSNVPAIQFWSFPNMNASATVYTDASGNSSFSYKNDPQGIIKLVPGGSQAVPIQTSTTQESSLVCNYCGGRVDPGCPPQMAACATSQQSDGGILGAICWCLSCMSSIGFICFIGFIVYMALKKQP